MQKKNGKSELHTLLNDKFDPSPLINFGVDLHNRTIYYGEVGRNDEENYRWANSITPSNINVVVRAINYLASVSSEPIKLHFNSEGGDTNSMFYLIDVIQNCPCPVHFYGGGAIMSAASLIMCVCDKRFLFQNATVMVHAGGLLLGYKTLPDLKILVQSELSIQDKVEQIYADNSRMHKEFWTEVCKRDLYLSAEEAVMLGLADEVILPPNRNKFREDRNKNLNAKINHNFLRLIAEALLKRIETKNATPQLTKEEVSLNFDADGLDQDFLLKTVKNVKSPKKGGQTKSRPSKKPAVKKT